MSDNVIGWLKRIEREIDILKAFEIPTKAIVGAGSGDLTGTTWVVPMINNAGELIVDSSGELVLTRTTIT